MAKLFFLLSGEFESLSFAELKAILETEECRYSITEKLDQVMRLEANLEVIKKIIYRSAYTRICSLELFVCPAEKTAISQAIKNVDFSQILSKDATFEVRIRRVKGYFTKDSTIILEQLLGELILQKAPYVKVDLDHPHKTFFGVLTCGKLVFGLKLGEIHPKPFVERRPRKKPFFHPSAMNSKLARCMVNLAHAKQGSLVLDPFCGTGTTIIEAALIGMRAIGIDVQRNMAEGTIRNLKHFGLNAEAILLADARLLPLTHVDCIVTDPPYGKSATTLKRGTIAMVEGVFSSAQEILSKGQRICIASPKALDIKKLAEKWGYKHLESHFAYVHRSLTREVAVFQKE
ncbi:MAG: DNA methyltransferase [Candidatus Bathyarchaeia archaeon]